MERLAAMLVLQGYINMPAMATLQKLANELLVAFSLLNSVYSVLKTQVGSGSATPAATRLSSPQPDPMLPLLMPRLPVHPLLMAPLPVLPLLMPPPPYSSPLSNAASLSEAKVAGLHAECLAAELRLVSDFQDQLEQTSR